MQERAPQLSLEDLAQLVSGDADEKLQQRLAAVLRTDPRFTARNSPRSTVLPPKPA